MSLWMVLLGTVLFELWVLRRLKFDGIVVATVLAGTLVQVRYLGYTSLSERNYDGPSHVEYLLSIARQMQLPDVAACGACGHPPLYYALAAAWSRLVTPSGGVPFELGLQWLSLLLFFGFVVVALSIFRSRIERPGALRLATALLVFWPSSVLNSVRVHNDALASPLILAAMYFVARWDEDHRSRDFYGALATAAAALLTKSTGYAAATTLVLFLLLDLRESGRRREGLGRLLAALLVLGATAFAAVAIRDPRAPSSLCQRVVGNACDGRYVPPVPDEHGRFVSFDLPDFVRRTDTVPDDPKRDYFLNRLAKSSLFGVIPLGEELASKRHRVLGAVISSLLLLMIAGCAVALPFLRGVAWRRYRVYVTATFVMVLLLVAFRLRLPNPFHEDFRHVFPVLVPCCLGYVLVVERLGRFRPWLRALGIAVALSMVVSSALFFAA
jgi:hypothetical protein